MELISSDMEQRRGAQKIFVGIQNGSPLSGGSHEPGILLQNNYLTGCIVRC
jgi:hypothetical protein